MKRLSILITLAVFLAGPRLFAQGSNVVQLLLSNSATTGALPEVTNIGQSQHKLVAVYSNAPAQSCTGNANLTDLAFEASLDGTVWFEIGVPVTAALTNAAGVISSLTEADGTYPHVRINVHGFDTTHCRITLHYAGTLQPNPSAVAVLPNYQSRSLITIPINFDSGGAGTTTVYTNPSANRFPVMYGLMLSSTVACSLAIVSGSVGPAFPIPANLPLVLFPLSGLPWKPNSRGQNIGIQVDVATHISGHMVIRLEDNP